MENYTDMANQGNFLHSQTTFELDVSASQTGTHTLRSHVYGGVQTEDFEATTGQPFDIPNCVGESGCYEIEIVQPDGTFFSDGSDCPMNICVELHSCKPLY